MIDDNFRFYDKFINNKFKNNKNHENDLKNDL